MTQPRLDFNRNQRPCRATVSEGTPPYPGVTAGRDRQLNARCGRGEPGGVGGCARPPASPTSRPIVDQVGLTPGENPGPSHSRPAVRATDPDTSRAAWKRVEPRAGTVRARVLSILRLHGPMCGGWIAELMDANHNAISPRIAELRHAGLVEDTGRREPGPDERTTQIVWRATT